MGEEQLPSPAYVADMFVRQYYAILKRSPQNLHKFYKETSRLGWPGVDDVVTPVTTSKEINEKIMSSDYKYCAVEVKTTDALESLRGGIVVAVTGCFTGTDKVKKNFSQTFFLALQKKEGFLLNYVVLSDILRFFDVCECESKTEAPSVTCDDQTSVNLKAADDQNGKVDEARELNMEKSTKRQKINSKL